MSVADTKLLILLHFHGGCLQLFQILLATSHLIEDEHQSCPPLQDFMQLIMIDGWDLGEEFFLIIRMTSILQSLLDMPEELVNLI